MSKINVHTGNIMDENDNITLTGTGSTTGCSRSQGEIKASELVLAAIHHLKEARGSSPKEIVDYIAREYNCNSTKLKRSVNTALERGVQYGILRFENGHYLIEPYSDDNSFIIKKADGSYGGIASLRRRRGGGCGKRRSRRRKRSGCGGKRRRGSRRGSRKRRGKRSSCGGRKRRSRSRRRGGRGGKRRGSRRKSCGGGRKRRRSGRSRCAGKRPRRCLIDDDLD